MHVWSVQCNAFWWIHLCNHRPVKVQNTSLIQKVPSGPLPASISEGSHCSDFSHHSFALSWSSFKWNHTVRSSWRWLLRMLRCVQASMPCHNFLFRCFDRKQDILKCGYWKECIEGTISFEVRGQVYWKWTMYNTVSCILTLVLKHLFVSTPLMYSGTIWA